MLLTKMENLKPISHKEFNEFIKCKGFKGRNEYKLKELKAKFGFKPMYDRRTLTISSEDMSPTTFDSLRKASKATGISYGVLIYAKNKERNFVKSNEKIYNINWHNWQHLSCLQELTSTLLIQKLSQVHLTDNTSLDYQGFQRFLSICKFP